MFRFAWDSNVCIKTAMHWFQFSQIQELMSSSGRSFIWQRYSFSIHSVSCILQKWFCLYVRIKNYPYAASLADWKIGEWMQCKLVCWKCYRFECYRFSTHCGHMFTVILVQAKLTIFPSELKRLKDLVWLECILDSL